MRLQIVHAYDPPMTARLFDNRPMSEQHEVLTALLKIKNRADLSSYFATPNVAGNTDQIAWFADVPSKPGALAQPRHLSELSPVERAELLQRIAGYHEDLGTIANSYPQTRSGDAARRLLESLADLPDQRHVYAVGGQPVYIYWSHAQEQPIPEFAHPERYRIDAASGPVGDDGGVPVEAATGAQAHGHIVHVSHGWITFVGAISFFGITLASLLLAAVAIAYLVHANSSRLDRVSLIDHAERTAHTITTGA